MRDINHLGIMVLILRLEKWWLLWIVGSRVPRRIVVMQKGLGRHLASGCGKHARISRIDQRVPSKQGAREYWTHFHQIKKGVSVSAWKWSVKRYWRETLIKLIDWHFLIVSALDPNLVIWRWGKHLLYKKVVLQKHLLRLLHLWIDLDWGNIMRRWRLTLWLRLAVTCGFLQS